MTNISSILTIAIGSIGFFGFVLSFSVILNGWALWLLWGWFMVPSLSLPSLSLAQSIGVGMVISYATYTYVPRQDGGDNDRLIALVAQPLIYTLLGYTVHRFM